MMTWMWDDEDDPPCDDDDEDDEDSGAIHESQTTNRSNNRVNLKWNLETTEALIEAYITISEDNGKEQCGGLRPKFWKIIVEKLQEAYPQHLGGLDVAKCKNKWQTLKKNYVAYVSVFHRSGAGTHTDPKNKKALEELLQDYPEAKKFKDAPFL